MIAVLSRDAGIVQGQGFYVFQVPVEIGLSVRVDEVVVLEYILVRAVYIALEYRYDLAFLLCGKRIKSGLRDDLAKTSYPCISQGPRTSYRFSCDARK